MIYLIIAVMLFIYAFPDLKVNFTPTDKPESSGRAFIRCRPSNNQKIEYRNITDCAQALKYFGADSRCPNACLMLMSCAKVCPFEAISENLIVNYERCTGCGRCAEECPLDLIMFIPSNVPKIGVACSRTASVFNIDKCSQGCLRCYKCVSLCAEQAILPGADGLPELSFQKCVKCGKCLAGCPAGAMRASFE